MSVLPAIVAATQEEIRRLRAFPMTTSTRTPIDIAKRLRRPTRESPLALIAEIKKRSPSAGPLSVALSVAERAAIYADAGARMISVLVDREHFDGSYDDLAAARAVTGAPLLCKGFILDEVQLRAAHVAGADAVLLIVRLLDDDALASLGLAARALGLTPIVEVVDEAELERALRAPEALVLGVNARDLDTLQMNRARAERVLAAIPDDRVALYFSGISRVEEVTALASREARREGRRIEGALIGEALMRQDDPGPLLRSLVAAAG